MTSTRARVVHDTTSSPPIVGLVAAPHTPFDQKGALNLDVVPRQARFLMDEGVIGAFIGGTTGEGLSLTTDERMALAEAWLAVADPRLRVIVHVGHASVRESLRLTEHAAKINPFAVSAMPPSFFKPATTDALAGFCGEIAAAAAKLPFYYYHIPSMTQVQLPMVRLLSAVSDRVPNFRGIKFTHNDIMEFRQCLIFDGGRYDILFGRDELLLGAMPYGTRGAVGSTYNYAAPIYLKLMRAFHAGDLATAARCADDVASLVDLIREVGEIAAGKAFMTLRGVSVGAPRPPLAALTSTQEERVRQFDGTTLRVYRADADSGEAIPPRPLPI